MALINKLKAIANAIRSKTNKTEELTLEQMASEVEGIYSPKAEDVRKVTIDENGTIVVTPSEGSDVMKEVEVTTRVESGEGYDFTAIRFTQDENDEINAYHKDAIQYAMELQDILKNKVAIENNTLDKKRLIYFPYIDMTHIKRMSMPFFYATNLEFISMDLDFSKTNCYRLFDSCYIKKSPIIDCSSTTDLAMFAENVPRLSTLHLINTSHIENMHGICYSSKFVNVYIESIQSANNFGNAFHGLSSLENVRLGFWKQTSISLAQSSKLSSESIHYIIQNAVDLSEGATARTLTLHATAKTNWQNSEYYQQDLAVLEQKGITIA